MSNLHVMLPLQNESAVPLEVLLEPLSEYFIIQPGICIEIHAVFDSNTANINFTVAPSEHLLTIYAPGEISGFVDCYVTQDGTRLAPDGN